MSARVQRQRNLTAKETAQKLGLTERTIRNYIAEHRSDYEERAAARRAQAFNLRNLGQSWAEVATAMQVTSEAARRLAYSYKKQLSAVGRDTETGDLFASGQSEKVGA